MTVRLHLFQRKRRMVGFIDDEDAERCLKYRWNLNSDYYVFSTTYICPEHHSGLHRFIMKPTAEQVVDHWNGNPLDNRKQNLRICTHAENNYNSIVPNIPDKTSRFKGVCKRERRWIAHIGFKHQRFHLGSFDNELDAARSYDTAALDKFGEFALTNEMMGLFEGIDPHEARKELIAQHRWSKEDWKEINKDWLRRPDLDKNNAKGELLTAYESSHRKGKRAKRMIFHFPPGVSPSA